MNPCSLRSWKVHLLCWMDIRAAASWAFRLRQDVHPCLSWGSGLQVADSEIYIGKYSFQDFLTNTVFYHYKKKGI